MLRTNHNSVFVTVTAKEKINIFISVSNPTVRYFIGRYFYRRYVYDVYIILVILIRLLYYVFHILRGIYVLQHKMFLETFYCVYSTVINLPANV